MMQELSNDALRRYAPSIFATEAYHKMSERYEFIPTIDVVNALRDEGFVPVRASQSRVRIDDKRDFTKHMLRFRHRSMLDAKDRYHDRQEVDVVEIILSNGHDGSAAYVLDPGVFRNVCSNGLVMRSGYIEGIRIKHFGRQVIERAVEGSHRIVKQAPKIQALIETMKAKPINGRNQLLFAAAAAVSRYGVDDNGNLKGPIEPRQLLVPHRIADALDPNSGVRRPKEDVWTTFNVVQENMMKGRLRTVSKRGRRSQTRSINSVNATLSVNRDLWSLAEGLLNKNTMSQG